MKATLYRIADAWHGRLAIVPRPRGGDWLEDEIEAWRRAGIDVVVSALTREESEELDLTEEQALVRRHGIEPIPFPIEDRGVPGSVDAAINLLGLLESRLNEGKSVAIHCRQGVGRSALLAASVLTLAGVSPKEAFQRVEQARGCPVPDTREQRAWVARLVDTLAVRKKA